MARFELAFDSSDVVHVHARVGEHNLVLIAPGTSTVALPAGRHQLQVMARGSPGDVFSIQLQGSVGQPETRSLAIEPNGTAAAVYTIEVPDDDTWPGPRFA